MCARNRLLAGVCLGLAVMSAPAFAQGADETDVITVTAQKREQAAEEIPFSLDVITDERLDTIRVGAADVLFLAAQSPSVYAEASSGRTFPRFYIRGLGNTDFDLNANQPVSLVYDEVVLENPILKSRPVFDLDRIEILRGPQGTLFGRNTPAGVIKFESARPTREAEGFFRAAYGRFDTVDAEGAISGPITNTLSARLSGLYQRRDDFVDNTFSGGEHGFEAFEETAGRLQLLFEPDAETSFLFNLHGRDLDGGARLFRANIIEPGTGGLVEGFDRFETAQDADQILEVEGWGASLRVEAQTGLGALTSITAYETTGVIARGDVDGGFGAAFAPPSGLGFIPFAAETADNITDHDQITQETRLAFAPAAGIEATAGVFLFYETLDLENLSFDTLSGGTLNGRAIQAQETFAWAVFGAASWEIAPRWTLSGGLRLSGEEKDFSATRTLGPFGTPPLGPITRDLEDTVLSGDLSVQYALSDQTTLYGRYARGFRAPNVQGRIVFGDAVTVADTETIDSLEAGFKQVFAGGLGRVNGAVFYYETQNQQLTAVGGAGNFNQLLNADGVTGYGFELDGALSPFEGLEITAGVSLNETEIDDPTLEVGVCGAPCTVLDPINPETGNALIDGNSLPQAPRWIANGTVRYGAPVAGGRGEAFLLADIAYRSEINFFLYESAEFRSEPLTELGLRAGYIHGDGRWEIAAFGRNVFDETSLEGAIDFNNFSGFVNEPPLWGVELAVRR